MPVSFKHTEDMQEQLRLLAGEIVSALGETEPTRIQELLGAFVSELFLSATKQTLREERREQHAKDMERAKARGVKFGAKPKPLPDNFDAMRRSWRNGEICLRDAAKMCGMAHSTFYDAVRRAEEAEEQAAS